MKYNWKELEKEFILSDYKTVSAFLKEKNIDNRNGSVKKATKGWKEKKAQKEHQKGTKIIEKIIEKESEEEAKQRVKIDDVTQNLLEKINEAIGQLNMNTDMFGKTHKNDIVNRADIKKLSSALKDVNDIKNSNDPKGKEEREKEISNIQNLMIKIKEAADADTD